MKKNKDFSIIIPVYNEEENLEMVLTNLINVLEDTIPWNYEIICVNDGSTDNSKKILEKFKDKIKIIDLHINNGYGYAIKTGILNSKYDIILTFDADGQHNPEDIRKLIDAYTDKKDLVIGKRKITESYKMRVPFKFLLKKIINLIFEGDFEDYNSGFRVFNKNIAKNLLFLCSNRFSFSTSLTLAYYSFYYNVKFVPIKTQVRKKGKSYVNLISGISTIIRILNIGMIFKPFRVIFPFLVLFSFFAIISLLIDIINTNLTDSTVLFFCNTVIILFFGLLAEQIKNLKFEIIEILKKENNEIRNSNNNSSI